MADVLPNGKFSGVCILPVLKISIEKKSMQINTVLKMLFSAQLFKELLA